MKRPLAPRSGPSAVSRPWTLLALGLGAFLAHASGAVVAQETEQILAYDVTIEVGQGGAMDVREEIRVRALGESIRRGIYRDFPTGFPRWAGMGRIEAPFRVISVTRNGSPEPYVLESVGGPAGREGVRVRIGDAGRMLDHGVHDYVIEYETSRWMEFGEESQSLYWNVTGNGWSFNIRNATASIRFPGVEARPELESWTGREGSTGSHATATWDEETSTARFRAGERLTPGEGLTVRVTLPAGSVAPPTDAQLEEWARLDWGGWMDGGYLVLLVVAVYLLMWRNVGMDPAASRKAMRDTPPEGYSPSALAFIQDRGYDQRQLSAALVNLARRGVVRIEDEGDGWTLEKRGEPDALGEPLAEEEKTLFVELLHDRDRLELARENHARLRRAIRSFRSRLSRRLEREYFRNNRKWFAAGVAVSVLGFGALAWRWRYDIDPVALFLGVWLSLWTAGVGTLVYRVYTAVRAARAGGGAAMWGQALVMTLFSIPFVGAEIFVSGMLLTMVPNHLVVTAVVLGAVNVLFYHLLERPTLKGRGVLDELEAFRSYLESTAGRAGRTGGNLPEEQLRTWERNLPYAIALGLERQWTDAFSGALTPAMAAASGADGGLMWYSRSHGAPPLDASAFASNLGTGLSSTLTSMSSPPSSSGSGGGGSSSGGFSGGGGGGGGGGGW